jgi:hypothetical protein
MAEEDDEGTNPPLPELGPITDAEKDFYKKAIQSGRVTAAVTDLPQSGHRDPDLARREDEQDIGLKRLYAVALLLLIGVQVAFVDYIFYRYAKEGTGWKVDPVVMQAWLAATVIEVLGVVAIVVQHLFPRRDDPRRKTDDARGIFGFFRSNKSKKGKKPKNGD